MNRTRGIPLPAVALLLLAGIDGSVGAQAAPLTAALPTAVAVSAQYRAFYDDRRAPDWSLTRSGRPGPGAASTVWAGIVSHHLLAAPFIHDWFAGLAAAREVERFVVLAPRHFRQGRGEVVTTRRPWNAGDAFVHAHDELIDRLIAGLTVIEDDSSFYREHGVGTLVPFIAEYFPGATIVPLLIDPTRPWNAEVIAGLAADLATVLEEDPGTFLLVSADFSHHRDPQETARVDDTSAAILTDMDPAAMRRAYSDNTRGLGVLASLAARRGDPVVDIRSNTDSWLLWRRDGADTTSYFFVYLR